MKICKPILTLLAVSPLLLASPAKAAGHPEANDPTVELARKLVLKERPPLTAAELAKLSPEKQAALLDLLQDYADRYRQAFAAGTAVEDQDKATLPADPVERAGFAAGLAAAKEAQPQRSAATAFAPASSAPAEKGQSAAPAERESPAAAPAPATPSSPVAPATRQPFQEPAADSASTAPAISTTPPLASATPADTPAEALPSLPSLTESQQDFITRLAPAAQRVAAAHDLYPSVLLAQAALESSFGASDLARGHQNLFGIKGRFRNQGVQLPTTEHLNGQDRPVLATFRHYPDQAASLADYAAVLDQPCYLGVHRRVAATYRQATQALQGTYATDPAYAQKLNQLIDRYHLTKYDRPVASKPSAGGGRATSGSEADRTARSGGTGTAAAGQAPLKELDWRLPVVGGAGSVGLLEALRRLLR